MDVRPADDAAIATAAQRLARGGLVALPTETVYGLAADATNGRAVAAIFEMKGRPHFNPLIVHLPDVAAAQRHGQLDHRALTLANAFWPGPLTMVVKRRAESPLCDLVSAGLDTVALRVPAHPVARALLAACALPLAAPSANPSGYLSPTTAAHVAEGFGEADLLVLDGGPCTVGLESTVVDLSSHSVAGLLRAGGVSAEAIAACIGAVIPADAGAAIRAPGMLPSHYAPHHPVRLDVTTVRPDEAVLGFGANMPPGGAISRNLSPSGDLREAAANLFAMLHELDQPGITAIAVVPIPGGGLGPAIRDRLARAATGH
jgi:L-threonylcarbamoyladenylate synthase